jgi:hypothetical protein
VSNLMIDILVGHSNRDGEAVLELYIRNSYISKMQSSVETGPHQLKAENNQVVGNS